MSDDPHQATLGELIWSVRRDLTYVGDIDKNNPIRFGIDHIELEVVVETSLTDTKNGGLNLKVLGVGADGKIARDNTNASTAKIHVTITPRDTRTPAGRLEVAGEDTEDP